MITRVIIDGDSLHKLSKGQNIDVDFKRLREMYRTATSGPVAFEYFAVEPVETVDGQPHSQLRRLLDWLTNNGFRVRSVEADLADSNSLRIMRSELLVWMALEIAAAARRSDRIVVWSGDRALWRAVDAAQEAGSFVELVADGAVVPGALMRSADVFIDGRPLCPLIGKPKKAAA